jgi:hypothetical protein
MFEKILLPYLNLLRFEIPSEQLYNYLPVHNAMNIALSNQHKLVVLLVPFSKDEWHRSALQDAEDVSFLRKSGPKPEVAFS